jgi:hypothetical protein
VDASSWAAAERWTKQITCKKINNLALTPAKVSALWGLVYA